MAAARLITLPKELQLVQTPDRARSASDARRLAHLAKKVDQFNTLHVGLSLSTLDQSAASLASVIATRQERALQQRSQLLKSRSNPRFFEQQEEAHARVEQKWQQHHEQTRAQKHALEKRLEAAQKRHEESRQEIASHLSTRAASAGLQRRPSKSELAMTMETWLPQDSDRWMRDLRPGFGPINAPPSRPTTATTKKDRAHWKLRIRVFFVVPLSSHLKVSLSGRTKVRERFFLSGSREPGEELARRTRGANGRMREKRENRGVQTVAWAKEGEARAARIRKP